jgi:hypothetical protein
MQYAVMPRIRTPSRTYGGAAAVIIGAIGTVIIGIAAASVIVAGGKSTAT